MALSWSMDKLGPLCRSIEDCALVLGAIHGADGQDPTASDVPFDWDADRPLDTIRIGYMIMGAMDAAISDVDVFVTPSFGRDVLLMTNLTGHPAVALPSGFRDNGTPVSISFIGQIFGEAEMLRVAKAYQDATGFHLRRPPEFAV